MAMRVLLLAALTCCCLASGPPVAAAPKEVQVTATGVTRQDAITNGLVQALEQVRGVAIGSASMARTELASTIKGDENTSTITEQQQSAIVKITGGFISGYKVLDVSPGVPVEVQLSVVIEVFEAKGVGTENRRRIIVTAFAMQGASARAPAPLAELLRDRLTAHLVQARRFAVLDRAQDGAYQQEMQVLQDAPMAERVRIGQVVGADYVIVGKLKETAATQSSRTIGLTGEVVSSSTAGSAEADYQVLDIATRQIKYAASVRIAGAMAVDAVSARIAEEITQAIYPMRLIRFSDPNNLIVGQGGDSLKPGQRFRAMVLGEALTDPYTKEPLGQAEEEAGIIVIRRVESKLSYAQLVSGRLPVPSGEDVQIVLRPAALPPQAQPARTLRPGSSTPTVTKLPFDP